MRWQKRLLPIEQAVGHYSGRLETVGERLETGGSTWGSPMDGLAKRSAGAQAVSGSFPWGIRRPNTDPFLSIVVLGLRDVLCIRTADNCRRRGGVTPPPKTLSPPDPAFIVGKNKTK